MKEFVQKYVSNDSEFSKRFTKSIRNFMFIHVSVSVVACVVLTAIFVDPQSIVDVLVAMMPVYIALQGANYVKSGFENVKKIAASAVEEECENG